jgi:hypothetical protein
MPLFYKIRPVEAELLQVGVQTDGQTDRHDETNIPVKQFHKRA